MELRHTKIDTKKTESEINIVTLQREENVQVFDVNGNQPEAFHQYGTQWWTNPLCPHAFKYLNIDSMYPDIYFNNPGIGHPEQSTAKMLYDYMQEMYIQLFGKQFNSILELGVGGGEITRQFDKHQLDYVAVEGTTAGCEKLISNGITPNRIVQSDLKVLPHLGRKFDIVMCTEVAEHIEPWFASKVVSNCIEHANVVWFSAAKGTAQPHYHHINEVPIDAWDNLFAYLGFNNYVELDGRHARADRVYLSKEAFELIRFANDSST